MGRFRFAHALINQTLYEGLGATRRARMHQQVAETLERLYAAHPGEHLGELALHWRLAAVSVDKVKAADYALRAGQQALEKLAPAEAVKLFADAVELIGDTGSCEVCEALVGLGEAQLQTGDPAHRETLLEASRVAFALKDGNLAAQAALANERRQSGSSRFGEVDQERIEAIERALQLNDPPDPARRARLLALQAQELSWDPDFARRRALAEEAIALARTAGDMRALAGVLEHAFRGIWSAETLELRSALANELAGLAASLRDPAVELGAQTLMFEASVERGQLDHAEAAIGRWREIAEELGQPSLLWDAAYERAGLELLRGHLAGAERLAERAFQIGQEAHPLDAAMIYGAQLSFIRREQGRATEVIEMVEQSVSANPGIATWRAGLAAVSVACDREDHAGSLLEQDASDRFAKLAPNVSMLSGLTLYAEAAVCTRNTGAAAALYERMEPFSRQIAWTGSRYGHTRLWLGLLAGVLGDHERAAEHLAFANDFHEANDMPLWAARGHLGWAELLAAHSDAAVTREHATRALDLSRAHGYALIEERTAALAEAESASDA